METLAEQRTALKDVLNAQASDVFYTDTILDRFINRSVKVIANLYPWQEVQRGLQRSTIAGQEYLTYPENLRTDSVFFITVDGVEHKLVNFRDYERFKLDNPNSTEKLASDWRRKLFIHPTPTSSGDNNVKVWGQETPDELTNDADEHIFAYQSVLEEAIQMYALGLAYVKSQGSYYDRGKQLMSDALTMARNEWASQQRRQAQYKNENTVMFERYDLLNESGNTKRATFETCNH